MRAAVLRTGALVADTLPDPTPVRGPLRVRRPASGTCGSELHAAAHCALADGSGVGAPLVTGRIGVEDAAEAFRALHAPDPYAKTRVEPGREGASL